MFMKRICAYIFLIIYKNVLCEILYSIFKLFDHAKSIQLYLKIKKIELPKKVDFWVECRTKKFLRIVIIINNNNNNIKYSVRFKDTVLIYIAVVCRLTINL